MNFNAHHPSGRRAGVSEVLGALLLILVVIIAVTSLSIFLSKAQTNAENRQNYLNEVSADDLQFANVQLQPSSPSVQWEIDNLNLTNGTRFYISMMSTSSVFVSVFGNSTGTPATLEVDNGHMCGPGGIFNDIATGVLVNYTSGAICIGIPPSDATYAFEPATWESVTLTIRNLNTADSGLYQLELGGNWMTSWTELSQAGQPLGTFGVGQVPLDIPAKSSVNIFAVLPHSPSYAKSSSLPIKMISIYGNIFSSTYSPPVPVVKAGTASETYGVTARDIVTLDGSQSFSQGSTIQGYVWAVSVPLESAPFGCSIASLTNPADYVTAYVSGETIEYTPESLFPSGLSTDCITGPIQANLTLVDDNGFIANSQSLVIPQDSNIAPPYSLSESSMSCGTMSIVMSVSNIFGQPAAGVPVVAFASGDATISPSYNETVSNGSTSFTLNCGTGGAVEFTSGNLPPVTVAIP